MKIEINVNILSLCACKASSHSTHYTYVLIFASKGSLLIFIHIILLQFIWMTTWGWNLDFLLAEPHHPEADFPSGIKDLVSLFPHVFTCWPVIGWQWFGLLDSLSEKFQTENVNGNFWLLSWDLNMSFKGWN